MGAFGWLSGKKFMDDGGIPNIGLHDQRFALQWVKEYIERFGGDPERKVVLLISPGHA
jgi:carboxylesterase type B